MPAVFPGGLSGGAVSVCPWSGWGLTASHIPRHTRPTTTVQVERGLAFLLTLYQADNYISTCEYKNK